MHYSPKLIALGLAGALSLATVAPSFAGPLMGGSAGLRTAAPESVTDVRWRGRGPGIGPGLVFGLAAGALVGAAVASRPYGPDYYDDGAPYGAYEGPVYAEPYAPAPYYAPGYYGRGCFTESSISTMNGTAAKRVFSLAMTARRVAASGP